MVWFFIDLLYVQHCIIFGFLIYLWKYDHFEVILWLPISLPHILQLHIVVYFMFFAGKQVVMTLMQKNEICKPWIKECIKIMNKHKSSRNECHCIQLLDILCELKHWTEIYVRGDLYADMNLLNDIWISLMM